MRTGRYLLIRIQTLRKLTGTVIILGIIGCAAAGCTERETDEPLWAVPDSDPQQGGRAILRYGCYTCHVIEGVRKAKGRVGPRLLDIREQIYIGGVLANSPDNMLLWIQTPRKFSPETAMPNLHVTYEDSRDIVTYLYRQP